MFDLARHMLVSVAGSAGTHRLTRKFLLPGMLMVAALMTLGTAHAGQLVLRNSGDQAVVCTVDGFTVDSGGSQTLAFTVPPRDAIYVLPNIARAPQQIRWANCGQLNARNLTVTGTSGNQTLVFNGQQTRVLNVSLYNYLPHLAASNLDALAEHVIKTYQDANPQVLLNVTLDGSDGASMNIYSFENLPAYLGEKGFDVMELDMMYLGFLASKGLINRQEAPAGSPLKVALDASSVNGILYGIPSWLCMDFLYSTNQALQNVNSLPQLQGFLKNTSYAQTPLVGDYVGKWRLPSMYINAFVQQHGIDRLPEAFTMPPDKEVMSNLTALVNTCAIDGHDFCADKTYHNPPAGTVEQAFADTSAYAAVGFSEQSFYMRLAGSRAPLYVKPMTWGLKPQPLLYADSFVTSRASCPAGSPCSADAAALIALMTSLPMKNYIVMSKDYPAGTPWRTLLVPYAPFYEQREVAANALYGQYKLVLADATAFPNNWTASQQTLMAAQICKVLIAAFPKYGCDPSAAASSATASRPIILKRGGAPAARSRSPSPPANDKVAVPAPPPASRTVHGRH